MKSVGFLMWAECFWLESLLFYPTPNCFSRRLVGLLTNILYFFCICLFFFCKILQLNIVSHQNDKAALGVPGRSFSKRRLVSSIFHPTGRWGFFFLLFQSIFTVCRTGRTVKGKSDLLTNFLSGRIRTFLRILRILRSVSVLNAKTTVQQEMSSDLCVQAGT